MDISLILISTGFLFMYTLKVFIYGIDTMYNIFINEKTRKEEEKEKEIPESVKHLYN